MNSWLKPDWDRGYEKGRLAGVVEERARILQLLEDAKVPCDCGEACGQWDLGYDEAIQVIKGSK